MKKVIYFISRYMQSPRQEWRRSGSVFMIIGIIISVAALTVSFSVFEGYQRVLKESLLSTNSHIYVFSRGRYGLTKDDIGKLDEFFMTQKDAESYSAAVIEQAMITNGSGKENQKVVSCQLRGIDWEKEKLPIVYHEYITDGNGKLGADEVVIGSGLARKLNVKTGDSIFLISPAQNKMTIMGMQSKLREYKIIGIYHSGIFFTDSRTVFMRYEEAWKFSQRPGEFTRLEVKVPPELIDRADYISYVWENDLNLNYSISCWQDYNSTLFNLLEVEKWVLFFILSFLIVVASFNVVSTVSASIIERKHDIGILRAVGFSRQSLKNIFLARIIATGFAAIIAGELLGILLSWLASIQNFFQLKGDVYFLDRISVYFSIKGLCLIMITALVIITLAAMIPLREINRQNISEILRRS